MTDGGAENCYRWEEMGTELYIVKKLAKRRIYKGEQRFREASVDVCSSKSALIKYCVLF